MPNPITGRDKGAETFSLEANLNGTLVKSVDSAHAYAVIPANSEGEAVFTLTTTGADGRTATDSMTIKVTKRRYRERRHPGKDDTPVKPAAPAYNAKIAYPTKCTKSLTTVKFGSTSGMSTRVRKPREPAASGARGASRVLPVTAVNNPHGTALRRAFQIRSILSLPETQ